MGVVRAQGISRKLGRLQSRDPRDKGVCGARYPHGRRSVERGSAQVSEPACAATAGRQRTRIRGEALMAELTRRTALKSLGSVVAAAGIAPSAFAARPKGPLVENTMHMFAADTDKFPLAKNAPYKPNPNSL